MDKYANLTKEELVDLLHKIDRASKYGIRWDEEVTPEEAVLQAKNAYPVLKSIPSKSIVKNNDAPNHILIEGDNYHALMCLNYTHYKGVDLIYIDPPYNMGSKDFVYNDTYVDKLDSYKHSKWLSFMERRLKLARRLLKDDGCIFISINEEEMAQLKLLCDQIFGEKNYLTMFTVKVRHEDRILTGDKDFQEVVEYLLMYRKTDAFQTVKIKKDNTSIDEYVYEVNLLDDTPAEIAEWDNKTVKIYKEHQYEIKKLEPANHLLKRYNIRGTLRKSNTSGRFYVKHIEPEYKDKPGYLFKVENMGDDGLGYRYFLSPPKGRVNGDYFQGIPKNRSDIREVPYPNYMDFEKDFNAVGYEGGVDFKNGKKPINFLLKVFELGGLVEKENAVVLDFFGGSGSTAHALMEFNEIYPGNRQAILCQKNQEVKINVVDEVTLPRMNNILNGYTVSRKEQTVLAEEKLTVSKLKKAPKLLEMLEEKKEEYVLTGQYDEVKIEMEGQLLKLVGIRKKSEKFAGYYGNLRYFEIDFVNSEKNPDQVKKELAENSTGLISLKEGIFDLAKDGEDFQIFADDEKAFAVYFDLFGLHLDEMRESLEKINVGKKAYIFAPDPYGEDLEQFRQSRIDVELIPDGMIEKFQEVKKLND